MAVTYSTPGIADRITLSATPDQVTRVDFTDKIRAVEVQFLASDNSALAGKVARTGTDGQAIASDYVFVGSGVRYRLPVSGRSRLEVMGGFSLYIGSATASAIVEVVGLTSELA